MPNQQEDKESSQETQPDTQSQKASSTSQSSGQASNNQPRNQSQSQQGGKDGSSTGLEENAAGALAYLLSFISGIVFLIIEKDSDFVRFHAMQSTITFGGLFVLQFVIGFVPLIGWLISILIFPVWLILWIVLMMKAYQGERFKLPIVGNIAEQQLQQTQ